MSDCDNKHQEFFEKFACWVLELKENGHSTEEDFLIESAEFIFKEMVSKNLTKKEFAKFLGISKKELKSILRCEVKPSIRKTAWLLYKLGYEIKFSFEKI